MDVIAVRRESVKVDLEGNAIAGLGRLAAASRAATIELDRLGRVNVNISVDDSSLSATSAQMAALRAEMDRLSQTRVTPTINPSTASSLSAVSREADGAGSSINQLTGRLSLLADAAIVLGPGLVPIAAAGGAALGGLAVAATGLAVAGGAAILAFQGVGDAVEAVNAYSLDPTVENLEAAREAMKNLGPDARTFVTEFQKVRPAITAIRDAAAAGLFPGLTDSLDAFERLGPKLEEIAFAAGDATGFVANSAAESLVSDRWQPFLDVLGQEVPEAIGSISRVIGDVAHGLSEMLRVFAGDNGFLGWIEDVAQGFDSWASSAAAEDSLEGIMNYVRQNGPDLERLVTTLVQALGAIVEAAAPLGGPVLAGLTVVAEAVRIIADSDMATPLLAALAALRLFNRAQAMTAATSARLTTMRATPPVVAAPTMTAAQTAYLNGLPAHLRDPLARGRASDARAAQEAQRSANRRMMAGAGAGAGAMALLATGTADEMGATNAAMGAMIGSMMGPWGVAVGVAGGGFMDIMANARQTEEALSSFNNVLSAGSTNFADYGAAAEDLGNKQDDYFSNFDTAGGAASFLLTNPAETYNLLGDALDGNVERFGQYAEAASKADETTSQIGRNFMWVAKEMGDTTPITAADLIDPDVDRVQAIIDNLGPSLAKMGYSLEDVGNMTPTELDAFIADLAALNGQLFDSDSLLRGFVASLAEAQGFLSQRADMRAYEAALDDANKALKENGRTLDRNTGKGRANASALDAIASSGLKMAESMKGADRRNFLRGLRDDLIRAGRAFGMNDRQLAGFLDSLNLVDGGVFRLRQQFNKLPKRLQTHIENKGIPKSMDEARRLADRLDLTAKEREALMRLAALGMEDLRAARNFMDGFRDKTVYITTVHQTRGRAILTPADGTTVPKDGGSYHDRFPALLAPGEEVISNRYGQADRHRGLLKAINANAYANGGTAERYHQRHASSGRSPRVSVNVGGLQVTGVLDTPWGPAKIRGEMREVARQEIDADRQFEETHG